MRLISERLGLRERIWLTVVGAIAAVLTGLVIGFHVVLASRLDAEATAVARARASAELDTLHVTDRAVRAPRVPDAGGPEAPTWVFAAARVVERPAGPPALHRAAARSSGHRGPFDLAAADVRLYAIPIRHAGRRLGTVVASVSLGPYEQAARTALTGSVLAAALVLAAVALAARWLIARALRPVSEMTRRAAEWSEHDLERRFGLGAPRDEFTTLAFTLDGLLDRVAASLRHEQRLTAELSHELRTPLTQLATEAQLGQRRPPTPEQAQAGFARILRSAWGMAEILDTLLAAAHSQAATPRASTDTLSAAHTASRSYAALARDRGVELSVRGPAGAVHTAVDAPFLGRVLGPLLENACRHARATVRVDVAGGAAGVRIAVCDDGPGVDRAERERIFEPGVQGRGGPFPAARPPEGGAGLGLPLARRLARGVGGDVGLADPQPANGARFVVRLPGV